MACACFLKCARISTVTLRPKSCLQLYWVKTTGAGFDAVMSHCAMCQARIQRSLQTPLHPLLPHPSLITVLQWNQVGLLLPAHRVLLCYSATKKRIFSKLKKILRKIITITTFEYICLQTEYFSIREGVEWLIISDLAIILHFTCLVF